MRANPAVRKFFVLPAYCPEWRPPPFWPGSIGTSLPASAKAGYAVFRYI
jgi:hypothetical protein